MIVLDIPPQVLTPATMSKQERSQLLYLESCAVEYDGFVEGMRMNVDDHDITAKLVAQGLVEFGRVPAKMLNTFQRKVTHHTKLTDAGWKLAGECRKFRAEQGLQSARRARLQELL